MKLRRAVSMTGGWLRRHRKKVIGSFIAVMLLSVAIQLVYPYGRALPLASVAGQRVGMQERPAITLAIQENFARATATLKAGTVEKTDAVANLGARVNADEMSSHTVDYPLMYRFAPLSLLWYQPGLDRYQLEFDDSRLDEMSREYAKVLSYQPVDAGLTLDRGELEVSQAKSGQSVSAKAIRDQLSATSYRWDNTVIELTAETEEPVVSDASVADIRSQAETVLDQDITIVVEGREFAPDRATIASWLTLDKSKTGSLTLTSDPKTLSAYATSIAGQTAAKPTEAVVTTVDDRETKRQPGKPGRGIMPAELAAQLAAAIETPQSTPVNLALQRKPIEPPVRYIRNYTNSQAGLQAYAKDTAGSGDIQIAVRQLDEGRWSADGDADASIPSASTYKPLLMLRVFEDIKDKKLRWNSKIAEETIQQCFERMIVMSANECAEKLIDRYGVRELTDYLHGRGFSRGTGFTFSEATQATASDLARFMVGLEEGDLFQRGHRGMMLEKMGRQIFRQGIPAGTNAKTFGKVGFLWDYLHDMAIVDHPKGTYVLVVMTKGESWQKIASITRDIESILYGDGISSR